MVVQLAAMVLFEMGMGKMAVAGAVKLSASGSGSAAVSLLTPPHIDSNFMPMPTPIDASVPQPIDASLLQHNPHEAVLSSFSSMASQLWPKMVMLGGEMQECARELATAATAVTPAPVAKIVSSGLGRRTCEAVVASGAIYGILRTFGLVEEEEEKEGIKIETTVRGDFYYIPRMMSVLAVSDVVKAMALVDSIGLPLVAPLRIFCAGCILLSFPVSYAISWCKKSASFRKALLIELAACTVSLFWLTWGTHLLCVSPADAVRAPFLFWVCFVQCVLTWSGFSCAIAILLFTSAASAMLAH